MRFREHRGGLEASMATCVGLKTRGDLDRYVASLLAPYGVSVPPEKIHVDEYFMERDSRIGWPATYIVTVDGYGVLGFTDEAAPYEVQQEK